MNYRSIALLILLPLNLWCMESKKGTLSKKHQNAEKKIFPPLSLQQITLTSLMKTFEENPSEIIPVLISMPSFKAEKLLSRMLYDEKFRDCSLEEKREWIEAFIAKESKENPTLSINPDLVRWQKAINSAIIETRIHPPMYCLIEKANNVKVTLISNCDKLAADLKEIDTLRVDRDVFMFSTDTWSLASPPAVRKYDVNAKLTKEKAYPVINIFNNPLEVKEVSGATLLDLIETGSGHTFLTFGYAAPVRSIPAPLIGRKIHLDKIFGVPYLYFSGDTTLIRLFVNRNILSIEQAYYLVNRKQRRIQHTDPLYVSFKNNLLSLVQKRGMDKAKEKEIKDSIARMLVLGIDPLLEKAVMELITNNADLKEKYYSFFTGLGFVS